MRDQHTHSVRFWFSLLETHRHRETLISFSRIYLWHSNMGITSTDQLGKYLASGSSLFSKNRNMHFGMIMILYWTAVVHGYNVKLRLDSASGNPQYLKLHVTQGSRCELWTWISVSWCRHSFCSSNRTGILSNVDGGQGDAALSLSGRIE